MDDMLGGRIDSAFQEVRGARFGGGVHDHDGVLLGQDVKTLPEVGEAVSVVGLGGGHGFEVHSQLFGLFRAAVAGGNGDGFENPGRVGTVGIVAGEEFDAEAGRGGFLAEVEDQFGGEEARGGDIEGLREGVGEVLAGSGGLVGGGPTVVRARVADFVGLESGTLGRGGDAPRAEVRLGIRSDR